MIIWMSQLPDAGPHTSGMACLEGHSAPTARPAAGHLDRCAAPVCDLAGLPGRRQPTTETRAHGTSRGASRGRPVPRHIPVRLRLQRVAFLCRILEAPADEPGCPPSRPPSSCVDAAPPRSGRRPGSPRDLRLPGRPDPGEPRAPTAACCPPMEATSTSSPRVRSILLALV